MFKGCQLQNPGSPDSILCPPPRDAVAPHFSGWCLEEFSRARWFGGGAPSCPSLRIPSSLVEVASEELSAFQGL